MFLMYTSIIYTDVLKKESNLDFQLKINYQLFRLIFGEKAILINLRCALSRRVFSILLCKNNDLLLLN